MSRRYLWRDCGHGDRVRTVGPAWRRFGAGGRRHQDRTRAAFRSRQKSQRQDHCDFANRHRRTVMDEWGRVIKTEASGAVMKFVIRDPALNPAAMQQALTALIDEKPDVSSAESERDASDEGPQTSRGARHPRRPNEYVVQLQIGRFRRRRLVQGRPHAGRGRGEDLRHRQRHVR